METAAFVEAREVADDAPGDDDEAGKPWLLLPPQLPRTPTAIIEPSACSAPRRPGAVVSLRLDIGCDLPRVSRLA
jgi:hypothetical protein